MSLPFTSIAVVSVWAGVALAQTQAAPTKPIGTRVPPAPFQRLSQQASEARDADRPEEAVALYRKALALKPSWEEGWWSSGTINYQQDRYPQARDDFQQLVRLNPNVATAWAMLGLCEFQTRQYDDSLRDLGHGIHLGVEADQNISDVSHYHFALLLTRYEQYEGAMRTLVKFAERNMDQPAYVEAIGIAALRKPLLPSELPPSERELVMDVGRTMYDAAAHKPGEAIAGFKLLLEKYGTQPNIHYLYGGFLLFSDADRAVSEFKKELEVSPANVQALITLAAEYLRRHEFEAGLPYAEKAAKLDPQSFAAHAVLGRILLESESDAERGIKELELARKLGPDSPQVRVALASAYAHAGRKEDAARERQEFLKLKGRDEAIGTESK